MRLAVVAMAGGESAGQGCPGTPAPAALPAATPIARAFAAATDYDRHARVQSRVASELARRIAAQHGTRPLRLLEVGCGTGLLTRALAAEGLTGQWLITDLAPEMVARARAAFPKTPGLTAHFAAMDGEHPTAEPATSAPFDLIVASMAFQWFTDLPAALARLATLLTPTGELMFATLTAGTLAEWDAACTTAGAPSAGLTYPTPATLQAMAPNGGTLTLDCVAEPESWPNARTFLHALKAIGAATPRPGHKPLTAPQMRTALRTFESTGTRATWQVAYGRWVRGDSE